MKKVEKGIVFSNDIMRILEGNNAMKFSYLENGLIIPNRNFIELLRNDFNNYVQKIFKNNATVIGEEDMLNSILTAIFDVYRKYPHCLVR